MKNYPEDEKTAVRYLLGELADEERDRFEERLFEDEAFSVFLDDTENDLIDEYLRGELGFETKRRFETVYLSNESRRGKVEAAKVLHYKLFPEQPKAAASTINENSFWRSLPGFFRLPNPALAGGLATILLMILIAGIWLLNDRRSTAPDRAGADNSGQPTPGPEANFEIDNPSPPEEANKPSGTNAPNGVTNGEKPETPQRPKNAAPPPAGKRPEPAEKPAVVRQPPRVLAFSLLPPLRSSQNPVLKIPSSAQTVRLRLFDNFGQKYENFTVELSDGTGNAVWSRKVKAARSAESITVEIPNSVFKDGNHEISVRGVTGEGSVEEISFYNFAVRRK